jgi:hypothetical protein
MYKNGLLFAQRALTGAAHKLKRRRLESRECGVICSALWSTPRLEKNITPELDHANMVQKMF